jgi:hypothetical protein
MDRVGDVGHSLVTRGHWELECVSQKLPGAHCACLLSTLACDTTAYGLQESFRNLWEFPNILLRQLLRRS